MFIQVAYFKTESDFLVFAFTEDKICNWDTTYSSLLQHKWQVYNVEERLGVSKKDDCQDVNHHDLCLH